MKKNYFLILLTILLGLGSYSQTAVIGTPGTSINQYVPIEPYYDYSYSQSIYTAAELTASGMTGVTQIDTLVFEYNGSTLIDIYDWVIYMGNSNKSTFSGVSDYISLLSLSKNFDGVPIISGTASPYLVKIPLSTPFIWDGVSNLVISADENTSGWESRDFFTRSVTGNRSVYYYQDGTNVDPASPAASNQGTGSYVPNLTLSYSTPPACIPANYYAHSAEVNGVNATIRWDGVTGTAWEYQYGAPGFTLAATGTAVSVDSVNISGLSPLTNYEVRLRSVCGASSSPWSGPIYFTSGCAAPMAGNYTINPAFPTAGTNYNSFADALSQMALCGVGAPVKFNVAAGTYTGEILVETLLGASAANTVTFDGSAGVTLTNNNSSSSFATVRFKEASYVTFQNFTMTNTGYGRIVFFDENNDHITIKKCTFNCQVGTSSAFTAIYNESGYSSQPRMSEFITIDSNVINDGYQGVYMYGAGTTSTLLEEGNVVTNNTINRCHYYGVYMYRQQNTVVSNNTMVQKSVSPNTAGYGMYFRYCDLSVKINANKITLNNTTGTSYGLYIDNCDGNSSNSIDVTNNMIVTSPNGTSATQRGLYSYDSKYVNIYHNSVNLLKGSATSSSTAAFYTNASSTYKHNIQNNIFVNSNGGYAAYFSSSTFAGVDSITNNIFYSTNTSSIYAGGAKTLATVQTSYPAKFANCLSGNPLFTSATDLTLQGNLADGSATTSTGVLMDIDGDLRSTSTPDIGADEYIPPTCPSPSSLAFVSATGTTADVSWVPGSADLRWVLENGAPGYTPGTGAGTFSPIVNTTITGLSPKTDYDVYLRGVCGSGDTSIFVGPLRVRTGCLSTLSGSYTLNPAAAVTATNYITMDDFKNDLLDCGLGGAVTLNVNAAGGPYVLTNKMITAIPGQSATNTVTFNGNGAVFNMGTISGTNNGFMQLNGVKHLTINDFNFVNENNANIYGIMLLGQADSNTISNNTFDMGTTSTNDDKSAIWTNTNLQYPSSFTYGNNANYLTITGNTFTGGYAAMMLINESSNYAEGDVISNNNITNYNTYGIYTRYHDNTIIENNNIEAKGTSYSTYGMYMRDNRAMVVSKNAIHNMRSTGTNMYGMYIYGMQNGAGTEMEISNNAIYDMASSGSKYGIYFTSTTKYLNIYFNTIALEGNGTKYCIYKSGSCNNLTYRNNIFNTTGPGTAYGYYHTSAPSNSSSDNNVYNIAGSGTNYLGRWGSSASTLTALQGYTGGDINSVDENPYFGSSTNVRPITIDVDNLGTPIAGITTDITGAVRSTTTPDAGAYEFVGIAGDLSIIDAGLIRVSDCYGTIDTAWGIIKNEFGPTVDFSVSPLTANWSVQGPIVTTGSVTVNSGTLAAGGTIPINTNIINMSIPGTYTLSVWLNGNSTNASPANDTLYDQHSIKVDPIIEVNPKYDTLYATTDTTDISSRSPFYPGGAFLITEICQYASNGIKGTPSPLPSWLLTGVGGSGDYVEITGVPNSDLAGYSLEVIQGTSNSTIYTFPSGTVISPFGTAIIATTNGTPSPSNYLYAGPIQPRSSGDASGRILRDAAGNIIDAVGYNGYSFPASTGVTSAHWTSGSVGSTSTSWGMRLNGADINTVSGWSVVTTSSLQDPNIVNTGVTVPTPSSIQGVQWTDLTTSALLDTNPVQTVGPYSMNGTYPYEISFNSACGTYTDTAYVTVLLRTFDTTSHYVCDSFVSPKGNKIFASGYVYDTTQSTTAPIYDSLFNVYDVTISGAYPDVITITTCDSLLAPSGNYYDTSGVYQDTLLSSIGCDSIYYTINLTITTTVIVNQTLTVCDELNWRGFTFTNSIVYADTAIGTTCDSIFNLNLTVNKSTNATFNMHVCDSMVSPSGLVWYTSGTYYDTIPNLIGCDSAMVFNLNFGYISYASVVATACDSYTSLGGSVWTTSGVYTDTSINASGCDHVTTYRLYINYSATATNNVSLCNGQSYRVGPSLYTAAGTYTDYFLTIDGCDSVVTTNVSIYPQAIGFVNHAAICEGDSIIVNGTYYHSATTVNVLIPGASSHGCDSTVVHTINTKTVSPRLNLGDDIVMCNEGVASATPATTYDSYLWNTGSTLSNLHATSTSQVVRSKNYILTVNQVSTGCSASDTINITFVNCVGIEGLENADLDLNIYPNPATNLVNIEIYDKFNGNDLTLEVVNSLGQVVMSRNVSNTNEKLVLDVNELTTGMYLVRLSSDKLNMTKKLFIQK